ncbi:hypothetical protein HanPI659440_Chr00c01g0706801 [Helianthus annuus]|nr:hypothetical protein HanPI659440_Chr00c01g0706801 [Helianthus annuus]
MQLLRRSLGSSMRLRPCLRTLRLRNPILHRASVCVDISPAHPSNLSSKSTSQPPLVLVGSS